jgi:predicted ribosome-associated RNA-binding protein Tma20
MNALKKKLEGNLNERLKLRENEHNKLLQRYQNVKKEIENQQNLERIKYEKAFRAHNIGGSRPGTGFNSMMTSKMNQSRMKQSKMGSSVRNVGNPASQPSYYDR